MAQLGQDQPAHRQADRPLRARHHEDHHATERPRDRAAEHGRRADLAIAQVAEDLAESVEPLLEEGRDRLVGLIARSDARSAAQKHDAGARRGEAREMVNDGAAVVLQDVVGDERVSRFGEGAPDEGTARVERQRPELTTAILTAGIMFASTGAG